MSKANEPAYPHHVVSTDSLGYATSKEAEGLTKKERLAMEIYAKILQETPVDIDREIDIQVIEQIAQTSLRAADIFFEVTEKQK